RHRATGDGRTGRGRVSRAPPGGSGAHRGTADLWSAAGVHKRTGVHKPGTQNGRPPRGETARSEQTVGLGLAEDAVHLRSAHGAETLGHAATGVAHLDLAVEVALLLALDAVAVVSLRHGVLLVVGGDA